MASPGAGIGIDRKDEMHFEISIGPAKVAELITKLGLEKSE
jgi:hypothetical protein